MFKKLWSKFTGKSSGGGTPFYDAVTSRRVLPRMGTEELLEAYETSPWLRATTGRVARDVGVTTFRVYRPMMGDTGVLPPARMKAIFNRGLGVMGDGQRNKLLDQALENNEVVELVDHPVLKLLANPSKRLNAMQVMMVTAIGLNSAGEYYWWTPRGKKTGMPKEIWPIPPHWVHEFPTEEKPFFKVRHHKFSKDIPEEDMVRFQDPTALNPYGRGSGVGVAVGSEVDMDRLARDHILSFFLHGGLPDVLIGVDGACEESLKEAKRKFTQNYSDPGTAHGVHFYSGKVDVKTLTPSFKETQMIEVRQSARNAVMQVQGHPPEIHGVIENSNRSTIDAAFYMYAKGVLLPFLQLIAQTVQHQLMPRFLGGEALVFSFDSPVPEDHETQIEVLRIAPTVFKINEIRKMAGMPPIEGGEELFEPVVSAPGGGGEDGDDSGSDDSGKESSESKDLLDYTERLLNVPTRTH